MGVVFILALIMLVPLGWVSDLIVERSHFREVAKSSISQSWTGAQSITGPLLVIPYKIRTNKQVWDDKSKQYITKQQTQSHQMIIFPDELDLDVVSDSDVRYRGLHTVPVYTTQITVKGVFTNQRIVGLGKRNPTIEWEEGYVALALDDIRGVTTRRELDWQDGSFEFLSGSGIKGIENGMHAIIGQLDKELDRFYEFSFSFELRGMESLSFSAVGKSNSIKLKSDWPHPSFIGRLLPQKRTISDSGFEALWQASSFSTNIRQHMMGSVLVFFVLAVLMTVTRNVDWYKYDLKLQDKSASSLDSALTQTDFKNRPAS